MKRRCEGPCALNRDVKFFTPKGRVCATCQKRRSKVTARYAHLARTYGMEPWQVKLLLDWQNDACAICKQPRPYNLPLDHDHSLPDGPESWRGFLCKRCNKLLRDVRDSSQILRAAADYVEDPPARKVFACSTSSVT